MLIANPRTANLNAYRVLDARDLELDFMSRSHS